MKAMQDYHYSLNFKATVHLTQSMLLLYFAEWNARYISLLHHVKIDQVQEDSCRPKTG